MDFAKLIDRFSGKKFRPIASIVVAEIMLFLFSIESLIEWFNIYPKLFFLFYFLACFSVFIVLDILKQPADQKSWLKAALKPFVWGRTILSFVLLLVFFAVYIAVIPEYKVIAITAFEKGQFNKKELIFFTKNEALDELSYEIQTLIGPQYRVKLDDNLEGDDINSRLVIEPGIFDREKAVETIQKLEERVAYFLSSKEEHQIPLLSHLFDKRNEASSNMADLIEFSRKEIQFTDGLVGNNKNEGKLYEVNDKSHKYQFSREQKSWEYKLNQWFNKFKYILNI